MTSLNQIILVFWITWNSEVLGEERTCYQCATPNLQNNWGLTGLPLKPDNLKFNSSCDTIGNALDHPELISGNCGSSCFELLIPVNGEYGFVKGCHENFVWDEFKVQNTSCQVNMESTLYAGIEFCSTDKCNKKFATDQIRETGIDGCDPVTTHSCKSCNEYDGIGSCSASTSNTCKGVYCIKTSGKMNGHFYESRGCGFFNPIGSNVCSWMDQVYNVSTGIDSSVSRKKRAISLSFQANQCYCQGELCNSSPRFSTFFFSFLSASFLVFL